MNWINIFGLIIVVLLLLPNIIFFYKNKSMENRCKNKVMNILEQIGRYGSMLFMVINIGTSDFGFRSDEAFVVWLISNIVLIMLYWIFWSLFSSKNPAFISIILAIIPTVIFISHGIFLNYWILVIFGVIFGVSHIYVTYKNTYTN